MTDLLLSEHPHRRFNPLTGDWILVSPHRARRPWQGRVESIRAEALPSYDPQCYLCPGNTRAGNQRNPLYASTFVFDNDFSALAPGTPGTHRDVSGLLIAQGEQGMCRVICFSPRHDLTLAEMDAPSIRKVVDVWTDQYLDLASKPYVNYVQIFENKGDIMGCSNPHPHGQIWAESTIPGEPARETERMEEYLDSKGRSMLADYMEIELGLRERIVIDNDDFVVLVPFWAVWPFETLVVSRRRVGSLPALTDREKDSFADIIRRLTARYDNLFETSFPYSAGLHQSPTDGSVHPEWHFHMHFYPPLLRSATVKKFMVGYEMLANPQRDLTPESSAERLRELPDIHYKNRSITS